MIDFSPLEQKLKVSFKNKDLLVQAFMHRSYINENPGIKLAHNERLEFLGDAVLELVVTDHLYKTYPQAPEGELTAYRSALVNTQVLGTRAIEIGLNEYLLLSKGESKDMGKARLHILANTFESFIGALYLDNGYSEARTFIERELFPQLHTIVTKKLWRDSKSLIQEKSQEFERVTPSYKVLSESGPDHDKRFVVGVYFGQTLIAQGKGKSKQEAEQKAAQEALVVRGWLD